MRTKNTPRRALKKGFCYDFCVKHPIKIKVLSKKIKKKKLEMTVKTRLALKKELIQKQIEEEKIKKLKTYKMKILNTRSIYSKFTLT